MLLNICLKRNVRHIYFVPKKYWFAFSYCVCVCVFAYLSDLDIFCFLVLISLAEGLSFNAIFL